MSSEIIISLGCNWNKIKTSESQVDWMNDLFHKYVEMQTNKYYK